MNPRTERGLTLIELMVALTILGILGVLAVPSFNRVIQNNRMATQVNEMVGTLTVARSEAIKQGTSVTVCKSADGSACAGSGTWTQGWIVFLDVGGDGAVDAGTDTILREHGALGGGNSLAGNAAVANLVTFNSRGFASSIATGATGTLSLCNGAGVVDDRGITIQPTGRTRLAVAAEVSCP